MADGYVLESYWSKRYWFVTFPYWQTNVALPSVSSNAKYVVRFDNRTTDIESEDRSFVLSDDIRTEEIVIE